MQPRGLGLMLLAVCGLFFLKVEAARPTIKGTDNRNGLEAELSGAKYHWALLISGSNMWYNYRHQADVCHAYQILKKDGLPDERIVVMIYDDIAYNDWNNYPGQIFNKPGGEDVYPGCAKDYMQEAVNTHVFLSVLNGSADAVEHIGSGRVVNSTAEDRVFVYYADHGASGELGMPDWDDPLYADELHAVLKNMAERRAFKELVFYVEACEAGSMFEGILEEDLGIYAVTAANASESSWATYCPDDFDDYASSSGSIIPNATYLGVCMGDLFSVSWMEDTERENIIDQTLECQYERVKERTSNDGTYTYGSHVKRYGEEKFEQEPIGDFLGPYSLPPVQGLSRGCKQGGSTDHEVVSIPQNDARIAHLMHRLRTADTEAGRTATLHEIHALLAERERVDSSIKKTVRHLVDAGAVASNSGNTDDSFVLALMKDTMGRPRPGVPVVDSWNCLRDFRRIWQGHCGKLDPEFREIKRVFVNLCNADVSVQDFYAAVHLSGCQEKVSRNDISVLPVT